MVSGLDSGELDARKAQAYIATARLLSTLGPEPEDEDRKLARTVVRGKVMHGMPPEGEEEWALAREMFDDDALREFARWERLFEEGPEGNEEADWLRMVRRA